MSQSNCTSLCQVGAPLWVSILSEKSGGSPTLNVIPHSKPGKFYRAGIRWISGASYITMYDMIVGGSLSKTNERSFVERSVVVQEPNFNDLKTIQINYLIIEPIPVKIFSLSY